MLNHTIITSNNKTSLSCGVNLVMIRNYTSNYKLPNEVKMAEKLLNNLDNYKYDLMSGDWFEYKQIDGYWLRLNKYQMDQKIFFY